jgi:hypothetical protein
MRIDNIGKKAANKAAQVPALAAKARAIVDAAKALAGAAHPSGRAAIRERVRAMNSYHSNRIEGHGSHF